MRSLFFVPSKANGRERERDKEREPAGTNGNFSRPEVNDFARFSMRAQPRVTSIQRPTRVSFCFVRDKAAKRCRNYNLFRNAVFSDFKWPVSCNSSFLESRKDINFGTYIAYENSFIFKIMYSKTPILHYCHGQSLSRNSKRSTSDLRT